MILPFIRMVLILVFLYDKVNYYLKEPSLNKKYDFKNVRKFTD